MTVVAQVSANKAMNFVNGQWVEPSGKRQVERRNPANLYEIIGVVPLSTREETRDAVQAAAAALPEWRGTPAPLRGNILARAAQILTERKDSIARLLTREEGKSLSDALGEVQRSINVLDYMAGEGRRICGENIPSELPRNFAYTIKQPLGVVACITPWNFPVAIPVWKMAPALVAGNTVIFKPATLTAFTAMEVVRVFQDAGLPPGVLNLVVGAGSEVGDELMENPTVKGVSFTGSNEIGTALYAQGAKRLCRVQCEMGGKNPIVVLEDADLDLAVESTLQGAFYSTGQRCTATSRAVVVQSIADDFVRKLARRAADLRVGDGLEAGVQMGPAVDEAQFRTVMDYIAVGKKEGATLVCGGDRLHGPKFDKGLFVAPTIFDHVNSKMRIAQEEIFGPVLSVIRVKDYEEALQVANDVVYGLSSAIYTNNAARIFDFVERVESGITHVNSPTTGGEAQMPFGGMKGTGVGLREQGKVAIDFFTELKVVYVDYTGRKRESNIY